MQYGSHDILPFSRGKSINSSIFLKKLYPAVDPGYRRRTTQVSGLFENWEMTPQGQCRVRTGGTASDRRTKSARRRRILDTSETRLDKYRGGTQSIIYSNYFDGILFFRRRCEESTALRDRV